MRHQTLTECPVCEGRGEVPSRLPFRRKACPECGGTAHVTPTRREQLIQKMKPKPKGHHRERVREIRRLGRRLR